jgi:hypothetical protein
MHFNQEDYQGKPNEPPGNNMGEYATEGNLRQK